ncbi:MAG TPA: DUF4136 domain-containing protein [Pyrinomonadaceae bacterium]|nr:DUF4136 domain-containing protein [Pyrinomonadaceae bacterium]
MRIFRTLWVLGLMLAAGGTAFGQKVTSSYDRDYGLSRLGIYEFAAHERVASDPLAADTLMEQKVKDALEDALQRKGYHPSSEGVPPHFLVSFHAAARDKTDERGLGRSYVQGTLIVDFLDAETGRLVWRGIATGMVGAEAVDLRLAEEQVERAAELLMEQFGRDLLGF